MYSGPNHTIALSAGTCPRLSSFSVQCGLSHHTIKVNQRLHNPWHAETHSSYHQKGSDTLFNHTNLLWLISACFNSHWSDIQPKHFLQSRLAHTRQNDISPCFKWVRLEELIIRKNTLSCIHWEPSAALSSNYVIKTNEKLIQFPLASSHFTSSLNSTKSSAEIGLSINVSGGKNCFAVLSHCICGDRQDWCVRACHRTALLAPPPGLWGPVPSSSFTHYRTS